MFYRVSGSRENLYTAVVLGSRKRLTCWLCSTGFVGGAARSAR